MWKVKRTAPTYIKLLAIAVELTKRAIILGCFSYALVGWIFGE